MTARVVEVAGRYRYRPACPCGAPFWGYVSHAAAAQVADAHRCAVGGSDA